MQLEYLPRGGCALFYLEDIEQSWLELSEQILELFPQLRKIPHTI